MTLENFLSLLSAQPENIQFEDTMNVISIAYDYTPSAFNNGPLNNDTGENEGSCKIFAFALQNNLTEQQTLHCFGDYYRKEVLLQPGANNHANIRQFIKTGFSRLQFDTNVLTLK